MSQTLNHQTPWPDARPKPEPSGQMTWGRVYLISSGTPYGEYTTLVSEHQLFFALHFMGMLVVDMLFKLFIQCKVCLEDHTLPLF